MKIFIKKKDFFTEYMLSLTTKNFYYSLLVIFVLLGILQYIMYPDKIQLLTVNFVTVRSSFEGCATKE